MSSARDVVAESYLKHGIVGIVGTATLGRLGTLTIDFTRARMSLGAASR